MSVAVPQTMIVAVLQTLNMAVPQTLSMAVPQTLSVAVPQTLSMAVPNSRVKQQGPVWNARAKWSWHCDNGYSHYGLQQLPRKKEQARDCVLMELLFCSVLKLELCSSMKTIIVLPLSSLLSPVLFQVWNKIVADVNQTGTSWWPTLNRRWDRK